MAELSGPFWYTDEKGRQRQTQVGRMKKAKSVKDRRREYLKDKVCAVCGEPGTTVCWLPELQPQPISASMIWNYSDRRREDYLEFTRVLCLKHFYKSRRQPNMVQEHGGGVRGKRGCKCAACIERNRIYSAEGSRKYRARAKMRKEAAERKKEEQGK